MMRSRSTTGLRLAPVLGLALALAACGGPAPAAPGRAAPASATPAVTSHGSALVTASPTNQGCTGGVHEKHLSQFACDTCHAPNGGTFAVGTYTFPKGTTTAGGTITRVAGSPTTCTVACHYPIGQAPHSVTWDTPGPLACTACHATTSLPQAHAPVSANATRADCQTCHDTSSHTNGTVALVSHAPGVIDPTSPDFHAVAVNAGIARCQGCHGQDLAGLGPAPSCASCHDRNLPAGIASWKVNCTMCHGGTDNQSGAPPSATWGNDGDPVRIGAHTVHGQGSAFAPAFDCDVCHVKPADALSSGHVDGITQVPFHGIATTANQQPRWDHATATCSNIYCHGATLTGGTNTTPVWTGGHGQVACGTCHGVPPPSPHPSQDPNLTTCASCHANTVDATGNLIAIAAGGKHLDGVIEATSSHPPEWTDPTSQWFHAYSANAGIAKCTPCHGPNLDQPNGGCGRCHDTNLPAGIASWKVNCTMCHGGTDNQTGAPPRTTWGKTAEFALVGAHTAHVSGNRISAPFACVQCHVTPADALAPGHVNGDLTITFGGIATQGVVVPPAWNRTTATCSSTYCHGATLVGGTNTQPIWTTVNGTQAACGTCHGIPPPVWGHSYPPAHNMNACTFCHYDVADDRGTTITNPALHVNGVVNVRNRDTDPDCVSCHGIW